MREPHVNCIPLMLARSVVGTTIGSKIRILLELRYAYTHINGGTAVQISISFTPTCFCSAVMEAGSRYRDCRDCRMILSRKALYWGSSSRSTPLASLSFSSVFYQALLQPLGLLAIEVVQLVPSRLGIARSSIMSSGRVDFDIAQ